MYSCGTGISKITTNLENDLSTLLNWFYANGMVANPDMLQLMFLGLNEKHNVVYLTLLLLFIFETGPRPLLWVLKLLWRNSQTCCFLLCLNSQSYNMVPEVGYQQSVQ